MTSSFLSAGAVQSNNGLGIAPETRTHVYPAIDPSNFVGALKDKVAFVTGAGQPSNKTLSS